MMIHSRYSNPEGSAIVVVDIMRIKEGVFEERWDVILARGNEGGIQEHASHVWGCVHEVNVRGGGFMVVGRICRFHRCFRG